MTMIRRLSAFLFILLAMGSVATAQTTPAATTNRSVTITLGGTFQTILPSGVYKSIIIQNNNANITNEVCYIFEGSGVATTGKSYILDASHGSAYTRFEPYIPSGAIQGTCTTTNDTLAITTQ